MNDIKVISPEIKIIDTSKYDLYKLVEYVGRVCYQTQDKIDDISFKSFCAHGAKRGHRSIFEFNNLCFIFENINVFNGFNDFVEILFDNNFIITKYIGNDVICYGSIRAFLELIEDFVAGELRPCRNHLFEEMFNVLMQNYEFIVKNWDTYEWINSNLCSSEIPEELNVRVRDVTGNIRTKSDDTKILVRVVTSRGVHNEFVRHRMTHKKGGVSYMAESQRYVRYGKNKPFSIVVPTKYKNDEYYVSGLISIADKSFDMYKDLLMSDYSPSLTCAVLPRCTAIEYFIYTTIEEWRHIFRLRTSKYAHIEFQEVAKKIRDDMINIGIYI